MVIFYRFTLCFFICFKMLLGCQEISIEASINHNQGIAGQPLSGSILVTHPKQVLIPENSFKIGQTPLKTKRIEQISLDTSANSPTISIYSFTLPAKRKGLYTLDPIQITLNGKSYQSNVTTYEVKEAVHANTNTKVTTHSTSQKTSPEPSILFGDDSPVIFRLEAGIQGPQPLYPGQRAKLIYRITYNKSIDLSYSDLPLLYTKEFKKVGDEQIKDYEKNQLTYQDIVQEIETSSPGTFRYGPSVIEGYAYQLNQAGQKVYQKTKLRAEAPIVEVVVKPFPFEERPASFNGILGKLKIKLIPPTQTRLSIGDSISFSLELSGATNLSELRLPDLECQPGFSGFFQLLNLSSSIKETDQTKTFSIELRPISRFSTTIPSIEISSFDPSTRTYPIWRSQPIDLDLQTPTIVQEDNPVQSNSIQLDAEHLNTFINQINPPVPAIADPFYSVKSPVMSCPWIQTFWALLILPISGLILIVGKIWSRHNQNKILTPSEPESKQSFNQALSYQKTNPTLMFQLFRQAFKQKLKEPRTVSYLESTPETNTLISDIQAYLNHLDDVQYGLHQDSNIKSLITQAKDLFSKLEDLTS